MSVRVAIYTRTAVNVKDSCQPHSLDAQEERLRAYIRSQKDWQPTCHFRDEMSGATLDRPGLQLALAGARAHRYGLLLVYTVDRLSRSPGGLSTILHELDRLGITVRSVNEPFCTGSPAGRMMVQMLEAFGRAERSWTKLAARGEEG
jgi:site-specific DNA recombinase